MQVINYYQYGQPDKVLKLENCPIPKLNNEEVLVKVKSVGLNPRDSNIVQGKLKFISGSKFPKGIGADFSGIITDIGPNANAFNIGDQVAGYIDSLDAGAIADYIAVNQRSLVIKPANVEHSIASAIPCNYLTAWLALNDKAKITRGKKVIIYGASGGVGTAAIQIAKLLGGEITAVCSAKNVSYCLAQGANYAIPYEDINQLSEKYDVFFQVYSDDGLLYNLAKKTLKRTGIFITLIPNPIYILRKWLNWITGNFSFHFILVKSDTQALTQILSFVEKGNLQPQISKKYKMGNYVEAINSVMQGHTLGKIVLIVEE